MTRKRSLDLPEPDFDWTLQTDELSILLLLPLPSPLYLRQFLNMVFISPTNSSLVQYWPPFNFFSMLEMSMGAWNATKYPFSYSKHSGAYKVAYLGSSQRRDGEQRLLSWEATSHLRSPWFVRLEGTAGVMWFDREGNTAHKTSQQLYPSQQSASVKMAGPLSIP